MTLKPTVAVCWIFVALSVCSVSLIADTVPVSVVQPEQQSIGQQLSLSGTLRARQHARLSARMEGLVARVLVDAGDSVKAGQVLLELDPALAQRRLQQLVAASQVSTSEWEEAQRLVSEAEQLSAQQLFPQTELALRQANLARATALQQQAQAALAQQQEVLDRHQLIAPFSGVIAAKLTEAGEWVNLASPVLELVALSPLYLDVQMPQEHFQSLLQLQQVRVRSDMQPDVELDAQLLATVPVIDAAARSFLVRLQLEPQAGMAQLLPGTSASALFSLAAAERQSVVVPADAILRHPDGSFSVFSVRDNTAYRRLVTLGRRTANGVEVRAGLPEGEAMVVRGNETLRDGQQVRISSLQD
ncbi:efflux RND transporter periplasmic adaptor subunit [Arsukibacterium sp.]|uniref:efflux RND transporter periplasmic adaptor subunit n=1 Tax=Arsukibacterium sp. TaxID=1977258 RepID=UPI002FD972CF